MTKQKNFYDWIMVNQLAQLDPFLHPFFVHLIVLIDFNIWIWLTINDFSQVAVHFRSPVNIIHKTNPLFHIALHNFYFNDSSILL